jgi:hypothetical protein
VAKLPEKKEVKRQRIVAGSDREVIKRLRRAHCQEAIDQLA